MQLVLIKRMINLASGRPRQGAGQRATDSTLRFDLSPSQAVAGRLAGSGSKGGIGRGVCVLCREAVSFQTRFETFLAGG